MKLLLKAASALFLSGFLFACGADPADTDSSGADDQASLTSTQPAPVTCSSHLDAKTCSADLTNQCTWYINTRVCPIGQPCPLGWCSPPPSPNTGSGTGVGSTGPAH